MQGLGLTLVGAWGWNKPIYDGGSEITGYMVEIALPEEDEWKIVTPPAGLKATSYTITNLTENQEYKIRIYAMNSEGIGEPALVPGCGNHDAHLPLSLYLLWAPTLGLGQRSPGIRLVGVDFSMDGCEGWRWGTQPEGTIGLPRANPRGRLRSPS